MAIHKTGLASSSISVHDYDRLIGMSKKDVIELLELSYNDINGNVWMYYLYPVFKYTKPNYLYLIFKNGKVTSYYLKKLKTRKYHRIYDSYMN